MWHIRLVGLIVVTLLTVEPLTAAEPSVSFELATEEGFTNTGAQKWVDMLKDLDQKGIRIRAGRSGDKPEVKNIGTAESPSYLAIGILTAGNRLLLEGGQFSLSDRAGIGKWIEKLKADGSGDLTAAKEAFGLTAEQLVAFYDKLAKPVEFTTLNVRAGDVIRKIVQGVPFEYHVTDQARAAFGRNEPVLDELSGLSSGTALAAALRPLGLVMAPDKAGGKIRLLMAEVREVPEAWPVGWPPQGTPAEAAPALYEYLPVEVKDTPLSEVVTAIQGRVKTPFLYDHNGLARQQIDLAAVKVSYPRKRVQYKRALDQMFFQGGLTAEIRVDEAGSPLVWVSPRKP